MRSSFLGKLTRRAALLGALCVAAAPNAYAVPSFARQTGEQCSACHTVFPELTAYGREFKLHGYTTTNTTKGQTPELQINYFPPLSAMILSSYTSIVKKQPGTQNGNVQLPDQASFFYAGRISDKLGAFAQFTYDGIEDHFSIDNTDIRFANEASNADLVYGVTLNNNPTVQDLWNTTPAWGFPYAASGIAPAPAAATQIDGTLAQQVAGLGAYALWHEWLYAELSLYRSSQIGANQPPDSANEDVIDGGAPYWRLALEHNWGDHSFEVGTYGMRVRLFPGGGSPLSGDTNRFRDTAVDAQYQFVAGPHLFTARSTWIKETQDWNASFPAGGTANSADTLKTFRLDGTYYFKRRLGGTLGYFNTKGDRDAMLYQPDAVDGSRTGRPDSNGWIAELDYLPWLNTKFSLQYTAYNKFNGAASNYDGFGRDAGDNNTLYLDAWLMF